MAGFKEAEYWSAVTLVPLRIKLKFWLNFVPEETTPEPPSREDNPKPGLSVFLEGKIAPLILRLNPVN